MNLGEMFRTWLNVLTKPGEEVFEEENSKPQATLGTALIMIVIAAVIGAFFTQLRGWMFQVQLGAMGGFDALLHLPLIVAVVLVSCLILAFGGMLAALLSGTN